MYPPAIRSRVYEPAALHTMGCAFDDAVEGLSIQSRQRPHMREELALCILRLFDSGETTPLRLSRMALAVVTDTNRWRVVGNRGVAGSIRVLFSSYTDRRPVAS